MGRKTKTKIYCIECGIRILNAIQETRRLYCKECLREKSRIANINAGIKFRKKQKRLKKKWKK